MHESVSREIETIGRDNTTGATGLLVRGLRALGRAGEDGPECLREAASQLWRAQPSMAAFRTVAAVVHAAADPALALQRFAQRVERAPAAIARHAAGLLSTGRPAGPLRLVTCSRSGSVEAAILAASARTDVIVACAEGRPALEGRRLAEALVEQGVVVELFSDAAIGVAVARAEALLVGADAITRGAFMNKVGTAALCALASMKGVPAYVLAGTEKIVPRDVFAVMARTSGPAAEIWPDAHPRIGVLNPYFEEAPLQATAAVVTDAGVLSPDEVEKATLWPKSFI